MTGARTPKPEHVAAALRVIETCDDPDKLRRMRANAAERGVTEVEEAAFMRLVEILPGDAPGSFAHDFRKTVHTFEQLRSDEAGKTIRLSRTRQKIDLVGIRKVLEDFATHPTSTDGYDMLIERGLPELTGEAVILRHAHEFPDDIVDAARGRLTASGVDVETLKQGPDHG